MGTNKVQKKAKGAKTVEQATGKKSGKGKKYSNVPPPKPVEEESDSEESSEEEVEVPVKKGAKATPKKVVKPQEDDSDDDSSEEDSSEEEEAAKPAPKAAAKKTPVKAAKPAPVEESSDEDDSSEEEEEEKPKPKAKAPAKQAKKPAPKKVVAEEEDSDDSEDSDDESEEEMETKAPAKAKAAKAKEESSEEEDSDEDDSEEEEAMEVKQTKAAVKRKKTEESSDEDDSEEEDSDEEEEDEPPAKKVKTPAGAKKAKANGDSTPAPASGDDMISIFIANVDPSTTEEQIQEFFEGNGVTCSNARMVKSRKFAYVDVASEEEFNKAVELSESELNGSNIRLERGRKMDRTPQRGGQTGYERAPPRGRSDGSDERTLFAKGLSYSTSNETLIETFGASDARIPMNEEGRPKGFAFIEFASEEAAEEALKNHQGVEIDGWSLVLDYCGSKRKNFASPGGRGGGRGGGGRGGRGGGFGSFGGGDTSNSKTLFVKGISHDATEDSIAGSLGATSVRIPRDRETNEIKGFAYADFEDRSGAQSAIDSYQGTDGMFLDFARERTSSPGGRGGFGGRGGGRGFGGRGGGRGFGGRGGGGRGFGGRGGGGRGRGGFGGGRGRGGFEKKDGIKTFQGKKKTFGDD